MGNSTALKNNSARRYDLDWLRILATLLLIPYHTARIFDTYLFFVQNEINSPQLELFTRFIDQWLMPLFFLIAGAAAKYSLDARDKKQYCLERFQKLFIPLFFGVLILVTPMGYLGFLRHNPDIDLTYYQYYPSFFKLDWEHIDGYTGTFTPSHLWFIFYLFCFSLITLPLFQYLKTSKGKRFIAKFADYLSQKPGVIFLGAIPLSLARMTVIVYFNPVYYILFFILGYLLLLDGRFEQSIEKINRIALILALIGTLFYLSTRISEYSLFFAEFSVKKVLIELVLSLSSWCWVMVILNWGRNHLTRSNLFLVYFNQAAYPIYIMHMPFIIIIGFNAVQWQTAIIVKFLFIMLASSTGVLLVYETLLKRFNWTRILFGMKLKTKYLKTVTQEM